MPYTDPITLPTAFVLDDDEWNPYIRDNQRAHNRWISYTPTWTAATTPSIGNGTLHGAYVLFEDHCFVEIHLTFGSTTNGATGGWLFELPFKPYASNLPNYRQVLPIVILNDGVTWYLNRKAVITGDDIRIDPLMGQGTLFTFGTNDTLHMQGFYRIN